MNWHFIDDGIKPHDFQDCIAIESRERQDEQKALLYEQRKAMLDYKDVLFRRCCLNDVELYKHTFKCKPAPEGKL